MDLGELEHLLRRTEYVVRPERVAALQGHSRAYVVDDILSFPTPPPIPHFIDHDTTDMPYDQWVFAVQWWVDRMVDSPKPMQEKMTWFWHGHFCTSWEKVNNAKLMTDQNQLFRTSALGNFRTLTHTMALQPAMLLYLDNVQNEQSAPNQNFARELMELFTLGVGHYTENDVTASARAWTGHGINWDTYEYFFDINKHERRHSTFMGHSRIWDGPDIIEFLLKENTTTKMVACKFLTKKLWQFFATENPSATVVNTLAQVLYDHDMEIKPWVRAMLLRDEFYSTTVRQGLVKSPVDFVVTVEYHTGLRGADLNPQWYFDDMGQMPFVPPNVAGWKTNGYWVNTSMFAERAEFARDVTWHLRKDGANELGKTPGGAIRTGAATVDAAAKLFDLTLSTITRTALMDYVHTQRLHEPWVGWWEATNLITMIMLTPEMHVA